MFNNKKVLSDLINLAIIIFATIFVCKFIFVFIHKEIIRIIIVGICIIIAFWIYYQSKDENSKSIGKVLSNKLIKKDKNISILKIIIIIIIIVLLDIVASILDCIIHSYLYF